MKNAIIFGINGQDGFYMNQLLINENVEVVGVSRSNGKWIQGSVCDRGLVESLIISKQPDYIFHFAANSSTDHQFLFENHETICKGTLNILESVYKYSKHTKVLISGSAMQFKNEGLPIDENTAFEALSPYSVSRIQSVYATRYFRSLGLNVYVAYLFNHDSPLRKENHISQKIVQFAKRVSEGSDAILEIGDLSVKKEYNFAGDIVRAIWILMNQDNVKEAVIGSGITYSISDWLDCCFRIIGKKWEKHIQIKKNFKADYLTLVSNPKLIKSLGWEGSVNIKELALMMMK